ncbi:MAG: MYXO-CTERM sorting domain-containing protein, partial [Planctomycetota bacterium]|nr:MYXO-CTERM sorting domain-containing protein [Planctomycetota bacterium]
GTNFVTARSVVVFTFTYNLAGANNALRSLTVETGNVRNNRARLYATSASSAPDLTAPWSAANEGKATINVIPTPGSLALLGLGALAAGRRRRAN